MGYELGFAKFDLGFASSHTSILCQNLNSLLIIIQCFIFQAYLKERLYAN